MKNTLKILTLAVISCLIMTACNSEKKQIETSAVNYLRAINIDCDFEKAKEYSTPETHDLMDLLNQFWSMSVDSIDDAFKNKFINSKIDILDIEMENDSTANVKFTITAIDIDGNIDENAFGEEGGNGELEMKKIDSQWLAHQPKESPEDVDDSEFEMDEGELEETDSI